MRYLGTRDHACPEGAVACVLDLELMLAPQAEGSAGDESAPLAEALRLINAAKNAIHSAELSGVHDWSDGQAVLPGVAFGRPQIDAAGRQPWVTAVLPVALTFVLDGAASH